MEDCVFCKIGQKKIEVVSLWEDDEVFIFLDRCAIREAHCQVITKDHYEAFEQLPSTLAAKMIDAGQRLARRMKEVYSVERVAFLFTGGDVPHVHAHVVPMHEKTDVTSARYIVNSEVVEYGSEHLMIDTETLKAVRDKLQFAA
jgi:histidine triad (HIT) family protein